MKMQTNHFVSKIITIMIECFDFQMIAIFFILSEFFDFEKKNVEKKLAFSEKIMSFLLLIVSVFLIKNLFLTDLLMFHFSNFSVILMIQSSAFSEALFSDFLKSASFILLFTADLSASVSLISLLAGMSMCF